MSDPRAPRPLVTVAVGLGAAIGLVALVPASRWVVALLLCLLVVRAVLLFAAAHAKGTDPDSGADDARPAPPRAIS